MTAPARIVGAGLAGLVAAHAWRRLPLVEAAPAPTETHRALLRFRTDAVGRLVGVPFRAVRVHKGIWARGGFVPPDIGLANAYARKVTPTGAPLADRSIWAMEPVDRWVAPDTLYEELLANVWDRVEWGCAAVPTAGDVSTAPLPATLAAAGIEAGVEFRRAPITVQRWRVNADLFQTIYYPLAEEEGGLYRASITGNTLIAESVGAMAPVSEELLERSFGVALMGSLGAAHQRYGKIAPIDSAVRKSVLGRLTMERGVYSLGRFATWRNILLDDVVRDIDVIRRIAGADAPQYAALLAGAEKG